MMERWAVSKESMKVFDLLEACAGALFALEQSSKADKDRVLSEAEIKKKIQGGQKLLYKLFLALQSYMKHNMELDPFMRRLIREIRRDSKLTNRRLFERTLQAKSELSRREVSPQTVKLMKAVYKNLMSLSTMRAETLSRSLT